MANIPKGQKEMNIDDLKSFIDERCQKDFRYPTIQEMMKFSNMPERTVERYNASILKQKKKITIEKYKNDIMLRMESALKTIDTNKKIFETIRDDNTNDVQDIILAADNALHCELNAINIMREGPDYLVDNDDNSTWKEEHIHRKAESEKVTEGIKSIFN